MSIPAGLVSPMKNHEVSPINVIFPVKKRDSVQKSTGLVFDGICAVEGLCRLH
jgi:hypothetical protein